MVSTKTLFRIAAYGGVALGITGFFVQMSFQKRVRHTTIYKETIETMRNSQKTVKHLGEPIKEGKVTIGEYEQNMRWMSVRVKGTKTEGNLRCDFIPNIEGVMPSQIYRVEIEFDDRAGRTYVLREDIIGDTI